MTIGIYKITNKVNNKIYIGQSVNIENRYNQHMNNPFQPELCSKSPASLDYAVKTFGVNNFYYEILEVCNQKQLNDREIYWIKQYNSFYSSHGYNLTPGGMGYYGEDHPRAILTEEQVWNIRELYNLKVPFREAWELYKESGITKRGFKKVWRMETWTHVHTDVYTPENLKWHSTVACGHSEDQKGKSPQNRAYSQELIDKMYADYCSGMNVSQIAKKYNRDASTIKKYMLCPIATKKVQLKGIKVKNIETNQIFNSLNAAAKWASCSANTINRHLIDGKEAGMIPNSNTPAHWIRV